jgi:hypothetical protein
MFSPASDAVVIPTLDVGFICPFVVIDPTDKGATTVVARRRLGMIDNFLPIPDAEILPLYRMVLTLPLYRMVLKLACVQTATEVYYGCCRLKTFTSSSGARTARVLVAVPTNYQARLLSNSFPLNACCWKVAS